MSYSESEGGKNLFLQLKIANIWKVDVMGHVENKLHPSSFGDGGQWTLRL